MRRTRLPLTREGPLCASTDARATSLKRSNEIYETPFPSTRDSSLRDFSTRSSVEARCARRARGGDSHRRVLQTPASGSRRVLAQIRRGRRRAPPRPCSSRAGGPWRRSFPDRRVRWSVDGVGVRVLSSQGRARARGKFSRAHVSTPTPRRPGRPSPDTRGASPRGTSPPDDIPAVDTVFTDTSRPSTWRSARSSRGRRARHISGGGPPSTRWCARRWESRSPPGRRRR